ncbi:MAG: thioredoxin family protein [Deltaproteobacteria bacterium]|nr:thioredoxin family protein [Deltaproteobacteria bacterium]MBI3016791.1 thioredoxin family protein [Deltaproteobacteria bacterium]
MAKRKIEVFIAGCSICDSALEKIKKEACPGCEVVVYDLKKGCATNECQDKAKHYGIQRVPAVVIDGKLADCCNTKGIDIATLKSLGLGQA